MAEIVRCDKCGKEAQHPFRGVDPEDREEVTRAYYEFVYLRVEANEDRDHGDFCSWQCLAEWVMAKALTGTEGGK